MGNCLIIRRGRAAKGNQSALLFEIDHTKIDAVLTNYPVMVKLDNTFDFSKIRADGKDLWFTDSNGVQLDHEVEYFNSTEEKAVYHVRIPSVSATVDTKFYCKFGDGADVDRSNKTGVWDSNFVMVQHMGDSLVDSTGKFTSINYGSTVINTPFGKGRLFANPQAISVAKLSYDFTVQVFFKQTSLPAQTDAYLIADWAGSARNYFFSIEKSTSKIKAYSGNGGSVSSPALYTPSTINVGTPYLFSATRSGTNGSMFLNGGVEGNYNMVYTSPTTANPTYLFADTSRTSGYTFIGECYSLRLSNIARSNAWIKADDHNLRQYNLLK